MFCVPEYSASVLLVMLFDLLYTPRIHQNLCILETGILETEHAYMHSSSQEIFFEHLQYSRHSDRSLQINVYLENIFVSSSN